MSGAPQPCQPGDKILGGGLAPAQHITLWQQCTGRSLPSLHAQGLEEVCIPGKSSGQEPTGLWGFGAVVTQSWAVGTALLSQHSLLPDLQPDARGHCGAGWHPRGAPHH